MRHPSCWTLDGVLLFIKIISANGGYNQRIDNLHFQANPSLARLPRPHVAIFSHLRLAPQLAAFRLAVDAIRERHRDFPGLPLLLLPREQSVRGGVRAPAFYTVLLRSWCHQIFVLPLRQELLQIGQEYSLAIGSLTVEKVSDDGEEDCCDDWTFDHRNVSYGFAALG